MAKAHLLGCDFATQLCALAEVAAAISNNAVIGCYLSLPQEPSTREFRRILHERGATVAVPRVVGEGAMEWCRDVLADDPHAGIPTPSGEVIHKVPDILIVPALAIDKDGYRLGQGGGYYDRVSLDVPRIAVIFDHEFVPEVPREAHDLRVDVAITPTRIVRFTESR